MMRIVSKDSTAAPIIASIIFLMTSSANPPVLWIFAITKVNSLCSASIMPSP